MEKTCSNGHTIGEDGVHADLVGLSDFIEVSLVARGAADQPRIVGQSDSKLQPASSMRLAAHADFKDRLIVQARSEEHTSELQSLMRISYAVFCLKTKKKKPSYF